MWLIVSNSPNARVRGAIATVTRVGDREGSGRDWRLEAATRPVLPPLVSGRDHLPRRLAIHAVSLRRDVETAPA
jgi:hypothetical protein